MYIGYSAMLSLDGSLLPRSIPVTLPRSRKRKMTPQVRYHVSSTYEDLRAERQQATQAILEAGFFPSGMELFPASDDAQWELIKRVIEESDYYVVIVAGRYGSLGPEGAS